MENDFNPSTPNEETKKDTGFSGLYPKEADSTAEPVPTSSVPPAITQPVQTQPPQTPPVQTADYSSYPYQSIPKPQPPYQHTYYQQNPYTQSSTPQPPQPGYTHPPASPTNDQYDNGLVVASLVMGICSLVLCCNFIQAIVGLFLGIFAKTPKKGMKTTAIILNIITILIGIIYWIVVIQTATEGGNFNEIFNQMQNGGYEYGYNYDYSNMSIFGGF